MKKLPPQYRTWLEMLDYVNTDDALKRAPANRSIVFYHSRYERDDINHRCTRISKNAIAVRAMAEIDDLRLSMDDNTAQWIISVLREENRLIGSAQQLWMNDILQRLIPILLKIKKNE